MCGIAGELRFDGNTPDALGFDYGWEGTANASASVTKAATVEVRRNLITDPRGTNPARWAGTAISGSITWASSR